MQEIITEEMKEKMINEVIIVTRLSDRNTSSGFKYLEANIPNFAFKYNITTKRAYELFEEMTDIAIKRGLLK